MKLHLNQEFVIVKQWTADSKVKKTFGKPTIHIIFRGVLDNQEYMTYIVEGFENVSLWEEILSKPNYKKLRIRFPGGRLRGSIIDADNKPEIVGENNDANPNIKAVFE